MRFERPSPGIAGTSGDAAVSLRRSHVNWPAWTSWASGGALTRLIPLLSTLGPAFVASIAYVDPGNFATNIEGGSKFGYLLLWVVVGANAMAIVIQYLSAKLGVVTGQNLPEICRASWPRSGALALWIQAEVMAIATDLAELVGAALGLNLLFGVPMTLAGGVSAFLAFAILRLESRGYRRFELMVTGLLFFVAIGFIYEACRIGPSERLALAALVPDFAGQQSELLAVAIIGATVMPHAIYLHSDLAKQHRLSTRSPFRSGSSSEVSVSMFSSRSGGAGLVNVAMLVVAAKLFHHPGAATCGSLQEAHFRFGAIAGGAAALAFSATLFVSGVASSTRSVVCTGQVVMQGFIGRSIPVTVRRVVTALPALIVVALGVNVTQVLIFSQVVLSFGIPFALVPLVILTARKSVMDVYSESPTYGHLLVIALTAVISGLNLFVLVQAL